MATAKDKKNQEIAELKATILRQEKEIQALKKKLEHMTEVFANAQRARFGQSSEKKVYVLDEDRLSLFNEAEKVQDPKAEEPTEEPFTVKAHNRKKKRTVQELAKNLPVEKIIVELQEAQKTCSKCGGTFRMIGKKLIRREMIIVPQQEKIIEYYSCTYLGEYTSVAYILRHYTGVLCHTGDLIASRRYFLRLHRNRGRIEESSVHNSSPL